MLTSRSGTDIRSVFIRGLIRRLWTVKFSSIVKRISRDDPSSRRNARRSNKLSRIDHGRAARRRKRLVAVPADTKMTTSKNRNPCLSVAQKWREHDQDLTYINPLRQFRSRAADRQSNDSGWRDAATRHDRDSQCEDRHCQWPGHRTWHDRDS